MGSPSTNPTSSNSSVCSQETSSDSSANNSDYEDSITNSALLSFSATKGQNDCKCSHFDYTIENQIRLRHKQVELINENLPLSFDILDRCQMLSSVLSSDSVFLSSCNTQGRPQPPPSLPPSAQKPNALSNCTCSGIVSGDLTKSKQEKLKSKFKSPKAVGGLKNVGNVSIKTESSPKDETKLSLATFSTKLTNSLTNTQVNQVDFVRFYL